MTNHAALIARLCEASEGSAELSVEWWTAMTGEPHEARQHFTAGFMYVAKSDVPAENLLLDDMVPCITTSLSAAWEETKARGWMPCLDMLDDGNGFEVILWDADDIRAMMTGKHEACTIVAALLAAEGER